MAVLTAGNTDAKTGDDTCAPAPGEVDWESRTFLNSGGFMSPMVSFLPPDLSTTFLVAAILPLILGFIVGVVIKSAIKIGIAIVILVVILIAAGIISPQAVLNPLLSFVKSGASLTEYANRVAGYLPYSSLTFVVGLAIGLLKG